MRRVIPLWLAQALMVLGLFEFLIAIARGDWAGVLIGLALAAFVALAVRFYSTTNVLERSQGRIVIETLKIRGKSAFVPPEPDSQAAADVSHSDPPAAPQRPRVPFPAPPKPQPSENTAADRLRQLEELRDAGLVTDAEYAAKRQEILDRV